MEKFFWQPNPHIAFPLGFGDMKTQSAVADVFLEAERIWHTVRIDAIAYDAYTKKEAKRVGSLERIFPGITKSMGKLPDSGAFWLYKVTVFTAKDPGRESILLIPVGEDEIRVDWFDDFRAALDCCAKRYGMSPSDFRKRPKNAWSGN